MHDITCLGGEGGIPAPPAESHWHSASSAACHFFSGTVLEKVGFESHPGKSQKHRGTRTRRFCLWRRGRDSRSPVVPPPPPLAGSMRDSSFAARVVENVKQFTFSKYPSNPTHAKDKTIGAQGPNDFVYGGEGGIPAHPSPRAPRCARRCSAPPSRPGCQKT